jgi:prepilin-type N-terminal cleavage/methylation domain-containing protein
MEKIKKISAFTLVELMVVVVIMALLAGAIIANYAGTRNSRNLKLAENQLVTYIREAQSYSLSSRELGGTTPVQYYVLRFDTASSTQYEIQGMYNVNSVPVYLQNAQTISLPTGVTLSQPLVNGTPSSCVLVAFQLPYAKILNNSGCSGGPPTVNASDDYQKILNFIVNNAATTVTSDSMVILGLTNRSGSVYVLINGITGVVCPTAAPVGNGGSSPPPTCLASY